MRNEDVVSIQNLQNDPGCFEIRWQLTLLCNYECDFCIQGNRQEHLRDARGESPETRQVILRSILSLISELSEYHKLTIRLVGGEVTILPDFPDILEELSACPFEGDILFHITTNLSRSSDYICRLYDIVNKYDRPGAARNLFVRASFYKAYTSYEEFSGKIRKISAHMAPGRKNDPVSRAKRWLLRKAGRPLPKQLGSLSAGLPILNDRDYAQYREMEAEFEGSPVQMQPILIRKYKTDVSPEIMEKLLAEEQSFHYTLVRYRDGSEQTFRDIQSFGASLEDTKIFRPNGYLCDAGVRNISIRADGIAERCPAIRENLVIGSLSDGKYALLTEPQICTSGHCSCKAFGIVRKPDDNPPV